jgi:hypothetical protein
MSGPLQERRSERNREPRRRFEDEQAYHRFQQQRDAEIAGALREAQATAEPSDSDESDLSSEEGSASENEEKEELDQENVGGWSQQLHDVHPPLCNVIPTVALPRHRVRTELGFLHCFLDPALIDIFVTNTNEYAIARGAVDWFPVTTEEMWRYLAIRIRQGIVRLPELHHYWEASYRDPTSLSSCPAIALYNFTATFTSLLRSLAINDRPLSRRLRPSTINASVSSRNTTSQVVTSL